MLRTENLLGIKLQMNNFQN